MAQHGPQGSVVNNAGSNACGAANNNSDPTIGHHHHTSLANKVNNGGSSGTITASNSECLGGGGGGGTAAATQNGEPGGDDGSSGTKPFGKCKEAVGQDGGKEDEERPLLPPIAEEETGAAVPAVIVQQLGVPMSPTKLPTVNEEGEERRGRVQFDGRSNGSIKRGQSVESSSSSSDESSSSSSESSIELSEARPPDGGWGWVVVAASFVVNFIADGITFSFGVIFVEFLRYFGQNKGTTAWIGGLFMSTPLLSGPIASFLTDRYGCRKVTIFGSILATAGFIISSQANTMTTLCITFGLLAGFGLSLCYVASVVIVAYYFDKRRSFATGLAVCGSGIGTFIFPPFIQMLLHEYGWRGTTLILAGLFLNLAVCGALMRDLPWTHQKLKDQARERKKNRKMKRKNRGGSSADSFSVSTNTASVHHQPMETAVEHAPDPKLSSSLVNLPTYVRNGEKVPIEVIELLSQHKNVYNVLLANYPTLMTPSRSFSDSGRLHEIHKTTLKPIVLSNPISPVRTSPTKKLPGASYLKDLRIHRLSVTYRGAMLNINRYRLRASSCPDIYRNSMTTIAKEKGQWYAALWDLWDLLVDMFDFSHFSDPKFLLFAMSNFLLYTWYDVPYVYLTDNAMTLGYSEEEASMLISIIGIINMIGEVILGWVGDRPWANAGAIYAICMVLCGGVVALIPLFKAYWTLCVSAGAFGFFIAANYALTCIILVELITLDRFTNAYGLLLLVQGVANLIGPPLGGWLCDITLSYNLSFYLAGFFIALSGLMLTVLPVAKMYKRYIKRKHNSPTPSSPTITHIIADCLTAKTASQKSPTNPTHI